MSPQIKPLIVGLASPGLFWLATSVALGQNVPAPQGPPTVAPTSPATYRALLLSNGMVVRGEIVDFPAGKAFCLKGSGGPVPYLKTNVLKAAGSVEELYQFQVDRLARGDTGERMKLARWCLTEKLIPQAKEQLEAIEQVSPDDPEVQRMLYNLAANGAERPPVDPALRRSSAEMSRGEATDSTDPRVVKVGRKFQGLPQIFDLPPAQAVKRANEFAEFVQPVLQQNCVKCHNEKYQGNFQLVEAKIRRDRTNVDILRANLDATLRLINQDDPSRSELLSAGLVPHGGNRNAIFKGPNDQSYMTLVTWIKRLSPSSTVAKGSNEAGGRAGFNSAEPMPGDGFATDRSARANGSAGFPLAAGGGYPPLPGNKPSDSAGMTPIPQSGVIVENYNESAEFVRSPGDNPQFPAPFVLGGDGNVPQVPPRPRTKAGSATGTGTAPQPMISAAPAPSQDARPIGPNAVVVAPAETAKQLPGMQKPLYPTKSDLPAADDDGAPAPLPEAPKKKPKKKIDDALLERLMKNRNGGAPATGTP